MAQFYKGLKPEIKKVIAVTTFPDIQKDLITNASRLDNNFRRLYHESKIDPRYRPANNSRDGRKIPRHPDEMDQVAESATKLYRKIRKLQITPKKEKGEYFNYGRKGYFARNYR